MEYIDALNQSKNTQVEALVPGSSGEQAAIVRFKQFFADFSPGKIDDLLDHTYAERLYFNDTLKTLHDRASLRHYLQDSAAATELCVVEVDDMISNGRGDYYFRWRMRIRFKRFSRGQTTESIGISQIRFDGDGRVIFHQDFWNAADGLFQHIPLLGWMIRKIKQRL
jgi:hypothetical protein